MQCTEYYVLYSFHLKEALPLKLVKYTKKQILDKIEALEGDLYSEVLTLTREEKDVLREKEKIQEEKEAEERAATKAEAEAANKAKRKRVSKKVQEEQKQKKEEG